MAQLLLSNPDRLLDGALDQRRRNHAQGTPLSLGQKPNELWCTDYKGEFLLGNKKYCYPLTVTDHASRYLLLCEALESTLATAWFEKLSLIYARLCPAALATRHEGMIA